MIKFHRTLRMPQIELDYRSFPESRTCDVPEPNLGSCEIPNESRNEYNFYSSRQLSKNGISSSDNTYQGRKTGSDEILSQLSLSVLESSKGNYNQGSVNNNRDLGVHPFNLIKGTFLDSVNVIDEKRSEFDFKNSCVSVNKNMRIINDSEPQTNGDISDFVLSLPVTSEYNQCLDISVANLCRINLESTKSNSINSHESLELSCSNSEDGDLSDILSIISFNENNTSTQNRLKELSLPSSYSSDASQLSLSELSCEFTKSNSISSSDSFKQTDSESQPIRNLSDILTSISFQENDTSTQNQLAVSSLLSSDQNVCLGDINVLSLNELSTDYSKPNPKFDGYKKMLCNSEFKDEGNLTDILASTCIEDNDSLIPSGSFKAAFSSEIHKCSNGIDFLSKLPDECVNKLTFSSEVEQLSESIQSTSPSLWNQYFDEDNKEKFNITKPTNCMKSSQNQSEEFSFFSVSPENVFDTYMLDGLNKTVNLPENIIGEKSEEISMLDLFKSVNPGSNNCLSEYLNNKCVENEENLSTNHLAEKVEDECEVLDIDLSTCLNTSKDLANQDLRNKNNYFSNPLDKNITKSSFDKTGLYISKLPRMNLNQSLLAKSLSCRPKKNPARMQKVASIKSELFKGYFDRRIPSNIKISHRIVEDTCQSDVCIIPSNGRRVFGHDGLCELQ